MINHPTGFSALVSHSILKSVLLLAGTNASNKEDFYQIIRSNKYGNDLEMLQSVRNQQNKVEQLFLRLQRRKFINTLNDFWSSQYRGLKCHLAEKHFKEFLRRLDVQKLMKDLKNRNQTEVENDPFVNDTWIQITLNNLNQTDLETQELTRIAWEFIYKDVENDFPLNSNFFGTHKSNLNSSSINGTEDSGQISSVFSTIHNFLWVLKSHKNMTTENMTAFSLNDFVFLMSCKEEMKWSAYEEHQTWNESTENSADKNLKEHLQPVKENNYNSSSSTSSNQRNTTDSDQERDDTPIKEQNSSGKENFYNDAETTSYDGLMQSDKAYFESFEDVFGENLYFFPDETRWQETFLRFHSAIPQLNLKQTGNNCSNIWFGLFYSGLQEIRKQNKTELMLEILLEEVEQILNERMQERSNFFKDILDTRYSLDENFSFAMDSHEQNKSMLSKDRFDFTRFNNSNRTSDRVSSGNASTTMMNETAELFRNQTFQERNSHMGEQFRSENHSSSLPIQELSNAFEMELTHFHHLSTKYHEQMLSHRQVSENGTDVGVILNFVHRVEKEFKSLARRSDYLEWFHEAILARLFPADFFYFTAKEQEKIWMQYVDPKFLTKHGTSEVQTLEDAFQLRRGLQMPLSAFNDSKNFRHTTSSDGIFSHSGQNSMFNRDLDLFFQFVRGASQLANYSSNATDLHNETHSPLDPDFFSSWFIDWKNYDKFLNETIQKLNATNSTYHDAFEWLMNNQSSDHYDTIFFQHLADFDWLLSNRSMESSNATGLFYQHFAFLEWLLTNQSKSDHNTTGFFQHLVNPDWLMNKQSMRDQNYTNYFQNLGNPDWFMKSYLLEEHNVTDIIKQLALLDWLMSNQSLSDHNITDYFTIFVNSNWSMNNHSLKEHSIFGIFHHMALLDWLRKNHSLEEHNITGVIHHLAVLDWLMHNQSIRDSSMTGSFQQLQYFEWLIHWNHSVVNFADNYFDQIFTNFLNSSYFENRRKLSEWKNYCE